MISPVKSRLTHYDNLGLTSAATRDEIEEAFAKRIRITITSPEEAVEHANKIFIAYETLRDPIKRRAYDAAIGPWDREGAAEQKLQPFIGAAARESPEHLDDASSSNTPVSPKKDRRQARQVKNRASDREALGGLPGPAKTGRRRARGGQKAAIEWPVPNTKSLDERAATHVEAEALGGTPGQAKNERRPRRPKKAQIDREARRGTGESAKKGRRAASRVSEAATDREALGGGTPAPAKKRRRQARRADKATSNRAALRAAPKRGKSAVERAADPMTQELRDGALDRADQVRSVAASEAPTSRFAAAGAGVIIAAFGILTLIVALVRGNYDQSPTAPRGPIATDEQPSIPSTEKETAARKEAVAADQTQSEVRPEASSIGSVAGSGRQASDTPHVVADTRALVDLLAGTPLGQADDHPVTGGQFEQNASRRAAVTPSPQSVTGQPAATPPQQLQVANRQLARTPPQPAPYRQNSSAAQGKPRSQGDASKKVSSSAIQEKICAYLPLTGTRLPQRVCLTNKEWKQVEEEQRYARTPSQPLSYRQTSSAAQHKPSTHEDAGRKVLSSAIEQKICTHLPLTGTRLPQPVCLTNKEWKQVEEAQR